MKKLIALMLSVVFIFSIIPAGNAHAADINQQAGQAYADIVQEYLNTFETVKNNPDYDWEKSPVNTEFIIASQYDVNQHTIYRIMDYNNDGIPELFIGLSGGTIYDVYTFDKGKAVQLMINIGYRAGTCILCKNGIIKDMWSGSAFENGVKFHKLQKNKNKLTTIMELTYDSSSATGDVICTKKVNGRKAKISTKQYTRLYKKYDKPVSETFYKADSKAVTSIRQGSFTYPDQKKWTRKTGRKTYS